MFNLYGMLRSIAKQINENYITLTIDERYLGLYLFSDIIQTWYRYLLHCSMVFISTDRLLTQFTLNHCLC